MNGEPTIRCLIVEDNAAAIDTLKDLLEKISFVELTGVCYSALEAIEFVRKQPVDLIFSDIEMGEMDGLSLAKALQGKCHFILISGYNREQAAEAYDLGVVDYIWKPVTMDRLVKALMAYENRIGGEKWGRLGAGDIEKQKKGHIAYDPMDFLAIYANRRIIKLPTATILYIKSQREYVTIYTSDGGNFDEYKSLTKIGESLEGKGFLRIHHSHIVNMAHVREIARNRSNLRLVNGEKLNISRRHAKELADEFDKWEGK